MRAQLLFIATAAASAFAFGWAVPPPADPPVSVLRSLRQARPWGEAGPMGPGLVRPGLVRPGPDAAAAAAYLAALNPPPAPPAPPPRPAPPPPSPPPTPPDVATTLAAAVTAVVQDPQGLALVVVQPQGSPARRLLRKGDVFADVLGQAWRVHDLTRHAAVLTRGGDQRVVPFFASPAGA